MNPLRIERGHCDFQVLAHQKKLALIIFITGMTRYLGGRQCEDEPAMSNVDRFKTQNVLEERAIRIGVLTVDNNVRAVNHCVRHPFLLESKPENSQCSPKLTITF